MTTGSNNFSGPSQAKTFSGNTKIPPILSKEIKNALQINALSPEPPEVIKEKSPVRAKGRKGSAPLTLKDRLSRLNFTEASKLLGPQGKELLKTTYSEGISFDDIADSYVLNEEEFSLDVFGAKVRFYLTGPNGHLGYECSLCDQAKPLGCPHVAAALSMILEEKMALGLAAPPPERLPLERLSEEDLVERAISERRERVTTDNLTVNTAPKGTIWGDYSVDNPKTGRSYKVSVRGMEKGKIFCECPDFKVNTLGLCKHTMAVEDYIKKHGKKYLNAEPWKPTEVEVFLDYAARPLALKVQAPESISKKSNILKDFIGTPITDVGTLVRTLAVLDRQGLPINVFPDALDFIELSLHRERIGKLTREIRKDPSNHPLRTSLLKTQLLPYQLDGVAFAAEAGRAILADDMGLGKTIQGVGLAEFLAREAGVQKVLIICPASLKSQWQEEIKRFSTRSTVLVLGAAKDRLHQYSGKHFFTICNYEQITRDRSIVTRTDWDLLILDEAQRIKNWETASHRAVAEIKSRYLLILTGTPLENSLAELYTLVRLVDNQLLGPAFRFLNAHKETDEKGKLLAWRGLNEVKAALAPVFLRRTRSQVMKELPPRQTEIIRVPATDEQLELHNFSLKALTRIVKKSYLTEMDFLRLKKHLLACRLAANSTALVDKVLPGRSGKLAELWELLSRLTGEEDRKIIIFSEWTGMLNLVEEQLKKLGVNWARLDGSIPQTKRREIIESFTEHPETPVFLSTNAGSTGLNLQVADTVINLDLPWNPAILEQRIGRAHRMGQKRPVQVYLLVTADTIEERLLGLLGAKNSLSLAALDLEDETDFVEMSTGIDALKNRLEILLGRKPDKPIEEPKPEVEARNAERRQKISEAGGKLFTAALEFLAELIPVETPQPVASAEEQNSLIPSVNTGNEGQSTAETLKEFFFSCVSKDENGRSKFTFTLPDDSVIDKVTDTISRFLGGRG
ncbi:MAG: DEAD/DEAH box helicase [Deltaproteobacteria bacterium]|nr:DEAD/DEAH box helicase [Deltaproteobacteria bacterium]